MKRTLLAFVLGGAALCASTAALAHVDVGVSIGVPAPGSMHRHRSWWAAATTAIRTGVSANGAAASGANTNGVSASGTTAAAGTVTNVHGTPQPDWTSPLPGAACARFACMASAPRGVESDLS